MTPLVVDPSGYLKPHHSVGHCLAAPRSGAKSRTGPAPPPRCGVFSVSRHRAQKPQETETPHPAHNTHNGQLMLASAHLPSSPQPETRNKSQPQRASDRRSLECWHRADPQDGQGEARSPEAGGERRLAPGRHPREAENAGPGRAGA